MTDRLLISAIVGVVAMVGTLVIFIAMLFPPMAVIFGIGLAAAIATFVIDTVWRKR